MTPKLPTISRRGFLRSIGVTATISVVAPGLILPEPKLWFHNPTPITTTYVNQWANIVRQHLRQYSEEQARLGIAWKAMEVDLRNGGILGPLAITS